MSSSPPSDTTFPQVRRVRLTCSCPFGHGLVTDDLIRSATVAAASACIPAITWEYMSSVTAIVECPKRS